jgi:hypothetical protein
VDTVNIYDPMNRIEYRHMDVQPAPAPTVATVDVNRLPAGYPNGSPRTYLGRSRRTLQAA